MQPRSPGPALRRSAFPAHYRNIARKENRCPGRGGTLAERTTPGWLWKEAVLCPLRPGERARSPPSLSAASGRGSSCYRAGVGASRECPRRASVPSLAYAANLSPPRRGLPGNTEEIRTRWSPGKVTYRIPRHLAARARHVDPTHDIVSEDSDGTAVERPGAYFPRPQGYGAPWHIVEGCRFTGRESVHP